MTTFERLQPIVNILNTLKIQLNRVDVHLEHFNTILDGYGIEALTNENVFVNHYFQNIVGLYVNKGETYEPTIIYDTINEQFIIDSMGNFIENHKKNHHEKID